MHRRIKILRESLGLTQREFGEKLGVSRDVISNLEYNRVQPKKLLIKHICELYNVNENWILTGNGEMFLDSNKPNKKLDEAISILRDLQPDFQDYALEQIKKLLDLQENKKKQ